MTVEYYEMTIYLKGMKKPVCTAEFESEASMRSFLASLSSPDSTSSTIELGSIVFRKDNFSYAEIEKKSVGRK